MDFDWFLKLLAALERAEVEYVLVGGAAVNLHGVVRATEDVDLFLRPVPDNVERLKRALRSLWNDAEIDDISVADFLGEYPTLRYGPPGEGFVIDVLTRLGTRFVWEDIESEIVDIDGVRVRVATPAMLVRMKQGTLRPVDRADAAALKQKFGLEDKA